MTVFKYVIWSFLLIFSVESGFSQSIRISEIDEDKGALESILVIDSNEFIIATKEYTATKEYFFFKRYDGTQLLDKHRLLSEYKDRSINYKKFEIVSDTLSAFFSIANLETFEYYCQKFDLLGFPIDDPQYLTSIPRMSNKSWNNGGVLFSPDKSNYLIYCVLFDQTAHSKVFHYEHFSSSGKLLKRGEIAASKKADDIAFDDVWLTNNGKIAISEYVFLDKQFGERKSNRRMDVVRLHVIHGELSNTIILVPPQDEYLTHVEIEFKGNSISGTGIYCVKNDHFKGLFSFYIPDWNAKSDEIVVKNFPRMQSVPLTAFDLRFSNKKQNPLQSKIHVCNDMKLLNTFYHADSLVYVWERIATIVHKNSESYMGRDILIVKAFQDSILNCSVIPKSVVSGYGEMINLMSYTELTSPNEITILTNDYADLYDVSGNYIVDSPKLKRNRILKSPFGVVEIKYHLTNGSYDRKMLFDNTVFEVTATPVIWQKLTPHKMLLQFSEFGKYRFAYWDF